MRNATRSTYAAVIVLGLGIYCGPSRADDLLVGKFASETRENFGSDKAGEYQIEVTAKGSKYTYSLSRNGGPARRVEMSACSPDIEVQAGYLKDHPPGEIRALCATLTGGIAWPVFLYSENGIKSPVVAGKVYKTRYYAHVDGRFYGFSKAR